MNKLEWSVRQILAAISLVFLSRLAVASPTPQPGEQEAEQLQRIVYAINSALSGLVFVVAHAAVVTVHVAVVAALPIALLWLVLKFGVPHIPQSSRHSRLAAVRIIPPAEGLYEPARWIAVYRMLYAIALPWWKRAIVGQPWVTFELVSRYRSS
ncbi:MAG: hypothetical protein ACREOY_08155 [Candidatus Dormibacteraceae bacterium]